MKIEYLPEGSERCPLIRLFQYSASEVRLLREAATALASGVRQSIFLHSEPWIEPVHGCRLFFHRGTKNIGIRQVAPLDFECVLRADGWSNLEGLLDPLCESDSNGFQWLTQRDQISLLISQSGQW
jgi:hypothetical protein